MAFSKLTEWIKSRKQRVFEFSEGCAADRDLLGYKGSIICELDRIKVPVPPGFIIGSDVCTEFLNSDKGCLSKILADELARNIHRLEQRTGQLFGGKGETVSKPLLLSVRVSNRVHVPGLAETVVDLGLNDTLVHSLAAVTQSPRFAYDAYRRFLYSFGVHVIGEDANSYDAIIQSLLVEKQLRSEEEFSVFDLQRLVAEFKKIAVVPEDPWDQLKRAIEAVYYSWDSPIASLYRDTHDIQWTSSPGIVIQAMVHGTHDECSGSGFLSTRNPCSGQREFLGEYLPFSVGNDAVNESKRYVRTLDDLKLLQPKVYESLCAYGNLLETHFRDMQDIEFSVQNGVLYILEASAGKRSAKAAAKICVSLTEENVITEREALLRFDPQKIRFFEQNAMLVPVADISSAKLVSVGTALNVGAASGRLAFTSEACSAYKRSGDKVILCFDPVMKNQWTDNIACDGVLLLRASIHSVTARSARSKGCCAVGLFGSVDCLSLVNNCTELKLPSGESLLQGDQVTIDGNSGCVYRGYVEKCTATCDADYLSLLSWARKYKRMDVFASLSDYHDIDVASECKPDGVGMCKTDFILKNAKCRKFTACMILSHSFPERCDFLAKLIAIHEETIRSVLLKFEAKEVTFRLLELPLFEFLPIPDSPTFLNECLELSVILHCQPEVVADRIREFQENAPLLGFRGSRLAVVYPEIVAMQTKAIIGASINSAKEGNLSHVGICIPLVATDHEIEQISPIIRTSAAQVMHERGFEVPFHICASVDVPRSCMRADAIAKEGDVSSLYFDTDNLTQLTYGFCDKDSDKFLSIYMRKHIISGNPFTRIDLRGVGSLIDIALSKIRGGDYLSSNKVAGREVRVGALGRHGRENCSVEYFDSRHFDFISVLPGDISVAMIAAARAYINESSERYPDKSRYRLKLPHHIKFKSYSKPYLPVL